jgi:7,8-dihydroneopterin aldolase/epimerase/oxygenase
MSGHPRQDHLTSMANTLTEPAYTKLILQNVEVTVRVGLASWERERPQRLHVNIELYAASGDYLREVTAASIIDYSPIYTRIQSWQSRPHTELVETLVSDLLSACFDCPQVLACKVSVTKPEVFDRCQGAGAEAFMHRRDYERRKDKPLPVRLEV